MQGRKNSWTTNFGVLLLTSALMSACGDDSNGQPGSGGPNSRGFSRPAVGGGGPGGGTSNGGPTTPPTDGGSSEQPPQGSNQAPQLSGSAPPSAKVGELYDFKPSASDPDGDSLKFSISSKPSWASFDARTGRLWGTPTEAHVGSYEEILVSVSDGKARTSLPQFAVSVVQAVGVGHSATLVWDPPTENTDGTTLTSLGGYRIHYGNESGDYSNVIHIDNPGLTTYVVEDLSPGTYYFAITAVSSTGVESEFSGEASAEIG